MSASATFSTFRFENRRRRKPSSPCPAARDAGPLSASPSRRGAERSFAGSPPNIRVLVAFEDQYRAYRDTIAAAVRTLRPWTEVEVAEPGSLEAEIARLRPHLVICSRPNFPDRETSLAWVELPHETGDPATVWLEGRSPETADPSLNKLLSLVDEVRKLTETPRNMRGASGRL